ncbi:DNA-binding protein [Rhodoferax sp. BLA1]|uniref:DNA-binding protein n=1 Tax=Rhodoferax sp. BLA1 TaxID=2576062 RepID=UPI0015D3CBC4
MKSTEIPAVKFAEIRDLFAQSGISCSEWARQNNVDRRTLYAVLSGKSRCLRGESYKIAVLLGLRPQSCKDLSCDVIAQPVPQISIADQQPVAAKKPIQPLFNWSWALSVSNYRLNQI